jgi:hypothetical protein
MSSARITFEQRQPWCRRTEQAGTEGGYWVRVGVENVGQEPARGCVGRMISLTTDGTPRRDIDPLQLRWAGVPRSRSFDPIDIRRDQREYLNVLVLRDGSRWRFVTFEDSDFGPGFETELSPDHEHPLQVAVFADNAPTHTLWLVASVRTGDGKIILRVADEAPNRGRTLLWQGRD